MRKLDFKVRKAIQKDREWIKKFIANNWGSEKIISRGKVFFLINFQGFWL